MKRRAFLKAASGLFVPSVLVKAQVFTFRDLAFLGNAPAVAQGSSLLNGLVGYWTLDEASGSRLDSTGSFNLTSVNTVGQGTGIIAQCATFVATSSQKLTGSTAQWYTGSFSLSAWVNLTTQGRFYVMGKGTDGATTAAYVLYLYTNHHWYFDIANGTTTRSIGTNGASDDSTGVWHHLFAGYDAVGATVNIRLDGGTLRTAAAPTGSQSASGTQFCIGGTAAGEHYFNGSIDEVGMWNRYLSDGEQTSLYNAGAGITYPF